MLLRLPLLHHEHLLLLSLLLLLHQQLLLLLCLLGLLLLLKLQHLLLLLVGAPAASRHQAWRLLLLRGQPRHDKAASRPHAHSRCHPNSTTTQTTGAKPERSTAALCSQHRPTTTHAASLTGPPASLEALRRLARRWWRRLLPGSNGGRSRVRMLQPTANNNNSTTHAPQAPTGRARAPTRAWLGFRREHPVVSVCGEDHGDHLWHGVDQLHEV